MSEKEWSALNLPIRLYSYRQLYFDNEIEFQTINSSERTHVLDSIVKPEDNNDPKDEKEEQK